MGPSPKVKEIKAKINKWGLVKLKSICTAKETIDKTKRQPTEWEKIFANDVTDKGLIFNIYKSLTQLNIKTMNTLCFPGGTVVENLPANAGDTGSSPGLGRSHMPRSN